MMLRKTTRSSSARRQDDQRLMRSGEINQIYAKWFTSRSAKGVNMNFPATPALKKRSPTPTTRV